MDVDRFDLAVAERYSAIVDFSRYKLGTQVILENSFDEVPGNPVDAEKTRQIMRFDVVYDAVDRTSVPADLAQLPNLPESVATRSRDFVFERKDGRWEINGRPFDGKRIDAFPRLGDTEVWRLTNGGGGWIHPIHIHLIEFFVLDIDGRRPPEYQRGLKDTILLQPGATARVIMRFEDFRGVYVFHCHNLEHEDNMMMSQFKVV